METKFNPTERFTNRQLEIIQAAGTILSQSGISGLTTKKLAKEMSFSESALYRHFLNREEIIVALLEYLSDTISHRISEAIAVATTPEEQFVALFQNQLHFFSENPHFVVAVFSEGLLEESVKINEAITTIMSKKINLLYPIITHGQQSGAFVHSVSAEQLVHIGMGSFRLFMFKWRLAQFEYNLVEQGELFIQSLLTLIKNKPL